MAVRYKSKGDVFLDSNGDARSGGLLNFYITATTTRKNTYTVDALTVGLENANPVVLNSSGRCATDIFLSPADYKVVLTNSDTTDSITDDPVHGAPFSSTMPAFLAYNSATDNNVTGAGTTVTVQFDTEVFDQGGNYNNSTNTFTAPVTGIYKFDVAVQVTDLTAAMTTHQLNLITTARTYSWTQNVVPIATGAVNPVISALAKMTAGDTASVTLRIAAGAGDTADIVGGSAATTYFSGYQVA